MSVASLMREWWRDEIHPESVVYFVRNPQGGAVKIGRTRNLEARLATLRTAIPDLEFLVAVPGGALAELDLHAHFADSRIGGEWFSPTMPLARMVVSLIRQERAA